MTWETCERLAAHCRKMGDEKGAKIFEERAARKKKKLGIKDKKVEPKVEPKVEEKKEDGKKSEG